MFWWQFFGEGTIRLLLGNTSSRPMIRRNFPKTVCCRWTSNEVQSCSDVIVLSRVVPVRRCRLAAGLKAQHAEHDIVFFSAFPLCPRICVTVPSISLWIQYGVFSCTSLHCFSSFQVMRLLVFC